MVNGNAVQILYIEVCTATRPIKISYCSVKFIRIANRSLLHNTAVSKSYLWFWRNPVWFNFQFCPVWFNFMLGPCEVAS